MPNHDYDLPASLLDGLRSKSYASCMSELRSLAEGGNYAARIALADIYLRGGDGVRKDYQLALQWLRTIHVEDDDTGLAASMLAEIYGKGLGTAADRRVAFKYLRRAVLCGRQSGLLPIAVMQKRGDGTLKKPRTAKTIFKSFARDANHSMAKRLFALCCVSPWVRALATTKGRRSISTS